MKSAAIMLVVAAVLILIGTMSKNWISGGRGSKDIHIGPMGIEACMSEGVCVDVPSRGIPGDIEAIMVIAMISGFASAAAAGTFGGMALAGKTDKIPVPPKIAQMAFGLAAFSMTFFLIRMISEKGEISWAGFPAIAGVVVAGIGLKRLTPFLAARPALPPGQPMQQNPFGQPGQQSQPMQPHPFGQPGQQSQPMNPYANQSQPMNPYANQSQPMQPHAQSPSNVPLAHAQTMAAPPQQRPPQMPAPQAPPPQQAATPNCPRCGTQLHFVAQYQRWFCPREQQYV
jgi:hypothetical protein